MFRKTKMVLAAALVLASASATLAEDGSSSFTNRLNAMTARMWGGGHELSSRNVALRYHHHRRHRGHLVRGARSGSWMNRASQVWDGGGK
jgi:hypothetical protein